MNKYNLPVLFLAVITFLGCGKNTCPGMDEEAAQYVPKENKLTYISDNGDSFTLGLEKFVTEDYRFLSSCDACQCRKGANVTGSFYDDMGHTFFLSYHISDDIFEPNTGMYKEDGYFQLEIDLNYSNIEADVFRDILTYKVDFENKIFQNIYSDTREQISFLKDTTIDGKLYEEVLVLRDENNTEYYGDVSKIIFARGYGVVKFYVNNGSVWTLDILQ